MAAGVLRSLIKIILALILFFGLVFGFMVLIIWLSFITHKVKFSVTDATLAQFNFTDNQLHYNLGLYITSRNPNKGIAIYYDTIEATAVYKDQKFDTQFLTPFYQSRRTTCLLRAKFEGQQVVLLAGDKLAEFNSEKLAGVYAIDVKLHLRLRLKSGLFKILKYKARVSCGFKVPLSSNGNSVPVFQTTRCDVDY